MFPTYGLFQNYLCPDNNSGCNRPYCHFYHDTNKRKKQNAGNDKWHSNHFESLKAVESYENKNVIRKDDFDSQNPNKPGKSIEDNASVIDADVSKVNLPSSNIDADILQKLISEAVKKVIAESSSLNLTNFDSNSVIEKLDANSIVAKAIEEVSISSKVVDFECVTSKEKKQHKLYLPPPNAPSYMPTPISELNRKKQPSSKSILQTDDEEYTPTSVISCGFNPCDDIPLNRASEESEITDFSSENEDTERRSDFDLLEEVLAEHSSNPERSREIRKRKKALSKKIIRDLPANINLSQKSKNCNEESSGHLHGVIPSKSDNLNHEDNSLLHTSPILVSSNEMTLEDTQEKQCPSMGCDELKSGSSCNSKTDHLSIKDSENSIMQDSSLSAVKNLNNESDSFILNSHRLVSQITVPSRPNTKVWTPVAKPLIKENSCQLVESVEVMLEKLDGVSNLSSTNKDSTEQFEVTNPIDSKIECSRSENDKEAKDSEVLTEDSDNSSPDTDFSSSVMKNKCHPKRNRSISSNSSDSEDLRRKKKKKKVHKKDIKNRKRRRHDSSFETEYYSTDSERRHSKVKSKRSKHKLHHYRKKKSSQKYKKRKGDRKKSRKRRHSYVDSDSNEESQSSEDVVIVDPSCIKKEKEDDLDVYIVKIEKPEQVPCIKVDVNKNNMRDNSSVNLSDNTLSESNVSSNSAIVQSLQMKESTEHSLSSVSSNIKSIAPCNNSEISVTPIVNFILGSLKMEDNSSDSATDKKSVDYVMEVPLSRSIVKNEMPLTSVLSAEDTSKDSASNNEKQQPKLPQILPCKIKKEPSTTDKLSTNSPQLSMFDTVAVKMEQILKPRILTEISLFDSVSGDGSSCKKSAKSVGSIKTCKSNKTKHVNEVSKAKESKISSSSAKKSYNNLNTSTGIKIKKHDLNDSNDRSKDHKKSYHASKEDKVDKNIYKSQKHSVHDHEKEKSRKIGLCSPKSSKSGLKIELNKGTCKSNLESTKVIDLKKKSYNSKHHHTFKEKRKSPILLSDSKQHKSTSAINSPTRNLNSASEKKSRSSKTSSRKENKRYNGSKRSHSEDSEKRSIKPEGILADGSDSPIPDLSALDELPEEDWDQLLSCNNSEMRDSEKKIVSSDSDEGIDYELNYSQDDDIVDTEDANNPKVMEECMKLFSEYDSERNSQHVAVLKSKQLAPKEEPVSEPVQKLRVAHAGASGNLISVSKPPLMSRKKTPNEVMQERFNKLWEENRELQMQLEAQSKTLEQRIKTPLTVPSPGTSISNSSVTSTSDYVAAKSSSQIPSIVGGTRKRIARAPSNVQAMLKSKAEIKNRLNKNSNEVNTSIVPKSTIAMSTAKGSKRVAHMPTVDVLVRPIVNIDGGTKVPQNIRQRYLNCFIDETSKFCDSTSNSYKVAIAEEKFCHQRASSRMVYLNLAVNIIKKLRSFQISEAALELLQQDPEYDKVVESSPQVTSSSSITWPNVSSHPVNPNHRVVSHFSVIASGGNKGSWSIQKSKKPLDTDFKDLLSDSRFPKLLSKYVLTPEQLDENGYPRPDPIHKGKAIIKKINTRKKISPNETTRYCDRCHILYEVDPWGLPVLSKSCIYHWGRPYKRRAIGGGLETKYSCCQGDNQADGCCLGTTHVSENFSPDLLLGYVRTLPKEPKKGENNGVYALDCEMCYTTAGNELTRITVIDSNKKCVYETFVLPDNPIIDYNTRFSGITEEQMEGVKVTLRDVQATLLTIFSDKTILIGHSLESDFSALKLIHDTVIDTSIVFPHKLGAPYKRALRNLASELLEKIIQNDVNGHDSAEDAVTCMDLMHWKLKDDLKTKMLS